MHVLLTVIADPITIQIGTFSLSFGLGTILYLLIAALVGLVAEGIVGRSIPFGFVGAIIAALVGVWLMTNIIIIKGVGDFYLFGVPLVRAFIGAIILVLIWDLITSPFRRRRRLAI